MPYYIVKYKENSEIKSTVIEASDEHVAGGIFSKSHTTVPSGDIFSVSTQKNNYFSYSEVPVYRRQWCFWLMYLTLTPIALGVLLFGDVYYKSEGYIKSFGTLNRIVAAILGLFFLSKVFGFI